MESKIIAYIRTQYAPEVILLGGSRSRDKGTEKSDWDFFLLGSKGEKEGFVEFEGARLDITLKAWPEENKPLTIPYGPLWPVKVLLDESQGRLSKVLAKNEEVSGKGPLALYSDGVSRRFQALDSWNRKIEKYGDNPMVEFYYAGFFYEIAIRLWFETRNKWPLTPAEGLSVIEAEDKEFYELLVSFLSATSNERIKFTEIMLQRLIGVRDVS